ncbi:MAG: flagellar M-ring protein FliF [Hyphomicrobiales bacterium]|nr:MAG: flagellar M-ring protein FliF [Hyphomicrobiales bacterium]
MNGVIEFFKALGPARLGAMGAVALILMGFFAILIVRISEPNFVTLYTDLAFDDSSEIIRQLETQNIPFELRHEGAVILVPKDRVLRLRMSLSEQGLPSGGGVGYEIFDRSESLGTTSFVQNINHLRALEGELARSIATIGRIRHARVHLVLPERKLFQKDKRDPTASIVLKVRGVLEQGQIRAIQHLVASAVDGLGPRSVSIIDETGRLLAVGQGDEDEASQAATYDERSRAFENRLKNQVREIISSVVGPGRSRVQITADLDFNRITEVSDIYDPDGQVVRSTQTRTETSNAEEKNGEDGVTVGNELPGANADTGTTNGRNEASEITEEVTNFEISRVQKTAVIESGNVNRLSVAVLVDGNYITDDAGNVTYQPRTQEALDQIARLVRSAVGFDEKRGDIVDIINMQFAQGPDLLGDIEDPGLFTFTREDYLRFIELGVFALITLIVMFVVVRPLVKKVMNTEIEEDNLIEQPLVGDDGEVVTDDNGNIVTVKIEKTDNPTVSAIELAQVEGAIQSDTVIKVSELVNANPEEATKIIRNWLNEAA